MRVERSTPSRPSTPVSAGRAQPSKQASAPEQRPQETWVQSAHQEQVEEREARSPERSREELHQLFPGIAEGLTCKYLHLFRETRKRNPKTLFLPDLTSSFEATPAAEIVPKPYAETLLQKTQEVLQTACGEVYKPVSIKLRVVEASQNNAGYEWVEGKARLTLQTAESFENIEDPGTLVSTGPFGGSHQFPRGLIDLISFVHEYGHALYDQILGVPAEVSVNFANRALSEGFAVLMELLAIDHLSTDPNFLESREDLKVRRVQRVHWLQGVLEGDSCPSKSAYAEGTETMVNLYRQGGLSAVREFINQITPTKANSLHRSDKSYQEALCRPTDIVNLLRT